jgi:hypothetical protein
VTEINTQRLGKRQHEVELGLLLLPSVDQAEVLDVIRSVPDIEVLEVDSGRE